MPIRSRQHVIEEESRRAFSNVTPPEWVVRPQEIDYGMDLQVQIFEGERATTLLFFVQLKGSDSLSVKAGVAEYRFKTERLRHYLESPIPVMLVAYDARDGRLFYDWVHVVWGGLDVEAKRKWQMQESVAVRLAHPLSMDGQKTVSSEVKQFYRKQIGKMAVVGSVLVSIAVGGFETVEESSKATAELVSWVARKDRGGKIRFVERDAEVEINAEVAGRCLSWRHLRSSGRIDFGLVRIDLSELAFIAFVRVYFCFMLSAAGLRDLALELLRSIVLEESGVFPEPLLLSMQPQISKLFAEARRSYEGVELAEFLLEKGHVDAAVALAVSVTAKGTEYVRQTYRGLLKRALGMVVEDGRKATILYGLANSLRCSGFCREAFVTYLAAAQSDPDYYSREYWWSETAGSLFVSGHHRLSRVYYEVAVALAGEGTAEGRRIGVLLADVLLELGRYPEARHVFDVALRDEERPAAEFVLKRWMAGFFAERFGRQFRSKGVALRMAQEAYRQPNAQQEELLSEVLPVDALCGFAWFNYAEALVQRGGEDGTGARLVTAILNWDWDCEASALAVLMLFIAGGVGDLWLMAALLDESVRRQGGGFWHALERAIRFPTGKENQARELVEKLREFAETSALMFRHPSDDGVTLRFIA
ncbi:DUF4365 domain-containing protein [Corallococcus exiguus]|uniref:DUF4365 domain-containing protein n=1 Tax=Corallococcus exiguus TaxID=83462 RepID=UPI001471C8FD|nr:DUF4365 domain-containing protein [Corallococcus exiguus]NNB86775.1 DUF4365 domain-containing protein [Corallococcus exiguus]